MMKRRIKLIALFAVGMIVGYIVGVANTSAHAATTSCDVKNVATIIDIHIIPAHIELPDGPAIELHGTLHAVLDCGIKHGMWQLSLQRHDFTGWRHGHRTFEWRTKDAVVKDLDGKAKGYHWFMEVKNVCQGKANWRLRLFAPPGETSDNHLITIFRDYYPSKGGRFFNCVV